jgi:2-(1,2-epoxy-1,2-dihydrophenyl)acetyl-CoA isomerase
MAYEAIELRVDAGVARLTLQRPDAANSLDVTMTGELAHAVASLAARSDVRVLLLRGSGSVFCAGGDVRAFSREADLPGYLRHLAATLHLAISGLARLDAPVIVAVQGWAAGAGLGIVAAADLAVAAETCRFRLAYQGVGLSPDAGTTWSLPRLVGARRAAELALTDRVLTATEARDWGLITQVVPDADLDHATDTLALRLAAAPPGALRETKRLLRSSSTDSLESHMEAERQAIARCAATDEARDAIRAFGKRATP